MIVPNILLGQAILTKPIRTARPRPEPMMAILILEDLLHDQGRNGAEEDVGVQALLFHQLLVEIGREGPLGQVLLLPLRFLLLRVVVVLAVGGDLVELDVVAVGEHG